MSDSWEVEYDVPDSWESLAEKQVESRQVESRQLITSADLFSLIFSFLDINKYEYLVHRLFRYNKKQIIDYWKKCTHYVCENNLSNPTEMTYYRNGIKHNDDDLPAYEYYSSYESIKMWYRNGSLHRVGKPAIIDVLSIDTEDKDAGQRHSYWENGKWKYSYIFYENGKKEFINK